MLEPLLTFIAQKIPEYHSGKSGDQHMVNPMVNKSISLACLLLISIVDVVMLELLLTLLHQLLANFSILAKSGDLKKCNFLPLKWFTIWKIPKYHLVSLACFLFATSFSCGRGFAGIFIKLVSPVAPILTQFIHYGKSGDHYNAIFSN